MKEVYAPATPIPIFARPTSSFAKVALRTSLSCSGARLPTIPAAAEPRVQRGLKPGSLPRGLRLAWPSRAVIPNHGVLINEREGHGRVVKDGTFARYTLLPLGDRVHRRLRGVGAPRHQLTLKSSRGACKGVASVHKA